jgi:hypothetical protein
VRTPLEDVRKLRRRRKRIDDDITEEKGKEVLYVR